MPSWIENELNMLTLYQQQTQCGDVLLPQFPDDNMQELDSSLRPQVLMSTNAAGTGNYFSNRVQAAMYGQAISVMLRLRHAPGNIKYQPGAFAIMVEFNYVNHDGSEGGDCDVFAQEVDSPLFAISGYFLEMEQAEAAIQTIGIKHIAMAHKTLMCVRE